jgi:hypothetical protein
VRRDAGACALSGGGRAVGAHAPCSGRTGGRRQRSGAGQGGAATGGKCRATACRGQGAHRPGEGDGGGSDGAHGVQEQEEQGRGKARRKERTEPRLVGVRVSSRRKVRL